MKLIGKREDTDIFISPSMVSKFKRCKRSFYLTYILGLSYNDTLEKTFRVPVNSMSQGTIVHRFLSLYYGNKNYGTPDLDFSEIYETIDQESNELFRQAYHENEELNDENYSEYRKQVELAKIMFEGYLDYLEETGNDWGLEPLFVEKSLYSNQFMIEKYKVQLTGQLDLVMKVKDEDNTYYIIDHKTASSLNSYDYSVAYNEQLMFYNSLLGDQLKYNNINRYIIKNNLNVLKKSKRTMRSTPPFYKCIETPMSSRSESHFQDNLDYILMEIVKFYDLTKTYKNNLNTYASCLDPTFTFSCKSDCGHVMTCDMMLHKSDVDRFINDHCTTRSTNVLEPIYRGND